MSSSAGSTFPRQRGPRRGTYSIVARDAATGALGVAVQSHWFSVGSVVPAASAGVGAIATQAFPDVQHKPKALALLREGRAADEVLAALLQEDDAAPHRQLAIIDPSGRAAGHTGRSCIREAGHVVGDGYVCQANMMRGPEVWPAMAAAYEATLGQGLTAALLAALDAAELAGGDLRGRQSAAMLIVPAEGTDADRIVDVRVDDSPEPLAELRRLVALNDAYVLADEGDALLAHEDMAGAAQRYIGAYEAAPDKVELVFWAALGLMSAGLADRGLVLLRDVIEQDERWLELLRRLDPASVPAQPEALRLLGR
ncbi:DUF1028 domain-containing protein [Amnibacterium sp. CER49]|uniref:DUF1028 domain-containing protein n=1 Tax=Amnibacterium sp. CER49 TaxID=3039161 RepID=UPI002448DA69|nr:DUF1028 domain-containing protein [Amnibacterium sp. CER49]MDH2444788.1 DUF1028 domain-containing protein [Amnibacterium sp. CER49]